jgi:hypothetical protein
MFGDGQRGGEGAQVIERNFILSPFHSPDAEAIGSELLGDIGLLASIEGEINRLYRMRQPFFKYIGSAEEDTQRAIEEVFVKRLKVEVKLEDMEESLKVIRPGVPASAMAIAMNKVISDAGYAKYCAPPYMRRAGMAWVSAPSRLAA